MKWQWTRPIKIQLEYNNKIAVTTINLLCRCKCFNFSTGEFESTVSFWYTLKIQSDINTIWHICRYTKYNKISSKSFYIGNDNKKVKKNIRTKGMTTRISRFVSRPEISERGWRWTKTNPILDCHFILWNPKEWNLNLIASGIEFKS